MISQDKKFKNRSRGKLHHAIRTGKVTRLPCIICGHAKSHAHHEDYSKPLDVVWLCHEHHSARHVWLKHKEYHDRNIVIKSEIKVVQERKMVPFHLRVDAKVVREFKSSCKKMGVSMTQVVTKIIEEFIIKSRAAGKDPHGKSWTLLS